MSYTKNKKGSAYAELNKKSAVTSCHAQFFIPSYVLKAIKNRQRPTFPGSFPPSIIGAKELN
ncbi:MAG: hypothetical protein IKT31_10100, partial [Firmicutes bacterium]|nr:hypothetical protein [Bacillota bacterium]